MTSAISFLNVSKAFKRGRNQPRAFQDLFISVAQRQIRKDEERFLALNNVTLNIDHGEAVGLIGSNGSGKSTSLKLISRIIPPTKGEVRINGRVTALLEIGAGFHPELSGRDNIYLNGTILGLSRKEIEYKINSIIDFAELSEFIDAPVRNYSSGMYARLGFSVSVHLNPDILLIDEVLSVGDQSFQQKCSEHILRLRRKGVTIFFVSHDLDTVSRLCSRAIWLDHGAVKMDDKAPETTEAYYKHVLETDTTPGKPDAWAEDRLGSGEAHISAVDIMGAEMQPRRIFLTNEPVTFRLHYQATERVAKPLFGLAFVQAVSGAHIAGPNTRLNNLDIPWIEGSGYIDFHINRLPFLPGDYLISTAIYDWDEAHRYDFWHQCARFTVIPGGTKEKYGLIALEGRWEHSSGYAGHAETSGLSVAS
jgi:ABC-type polysaccharide/polyol phosphate transport system ATPase subunit